MPINARLVVVGGEVKTAEIKLRLPCTIGRGRGCTIMLPQALVSRQHCELFESGDQMMVRDLGSLNGTFVNNQKINEPSPVRSEELLTIGTVTFRVMYESAGASAPPPGGAPVLKAKTVRPTSTNPAPAPAPVAVQEDDDSHPLEIGDFDFEETERAGSDTESPASVASPSEPLLPAIKVDEKPARPAPPAAAVAKPAPPAAKTPAPTVAVASPAVPAAEEEKEEEDDFQDFLKSLGK